MGPQDVGEMVDILKQMNVGILFSSMLANQDCSRIQQSFVLSFLNNSHSIRPIKTKTAMFSSVSIRLTICFSCILFECFYKADQQQQNNKHKRPRAHGNDLAHGTHAVGKNHGKS
jgi:hypothetical protein